MSEEKSITRALDLTPEQWQMVRDTLANGANERDFVPLMEMAKARRLNPLLRQIHFVERWDGVKGRKVWAVQVSIDGLRAIAERTGLYAGQDEPEFVDGPEGPTGLPVACKVKVYRKDWSRPAVGLAYWTEAVQVTRDKATGKERPNAMWGRMPRLMLAKVAEAMAIRKAFPEDTSGLYTGDEIAPAEEVEGTEDKPRESDRKPRQLESSPQRIPDLSSVGIEARSPLPMKVVDVGAEEVSDAQLPPALEAFYSRVNEIELPGEGISAWRQHRANLAPLAPETRETAWKALVAKVEKVGKMQNAKVWLRKAIADEDARRGQPEEPPPDGTSGPRKGPGPVASAEGSASVSGGTSGAPAATVTALVPEWATTVDGMRAHLADKAVRKAVEHSVRQHGKRLGATYRRLAAERIVTLDTPADDGTRLSLIGATQLVDAWAQQGPIARKAVAR